MLRQHHRESIGVEDRAAEFGTLISGGDCFLVEEVGTACGSGRLADSTNIDPLATQIIPPSYRRRF